MSYVSLKLLMEEHSYIMFNLIISDRIILYFLNAQITLYLCPILALLISLHLIIFLTIHAPIVKHKHMHIFHLQTQQIWDGLVDVVVFYVQE